MLEKHPRPQNLRQFPRPSPQKAVMAATATAAVTAIAPLASLAKVAVKAAMKAGARAAKVVARDVDAVDAVDAAAMAETARAAPNVNVLTPKASQCRWTPTCNPSVRPAVEQSQLARSSALIAVPALNAASVATAPVEAANATRVPSAASRAPKAVAMLHRQPKGALQKAAPTKARTANRAKVVADGEDGAVVGHARMARHARELAKDVSPSWASPMLKTPPVKPRVNSHQWMAKRKCLHHRAKAARHAKSVPVTAMAVNVVPAVIAASVKNAPTCASRQLPHAPTPLKSPCLHP